MKQSWQTLLSLTSGRSFRVERARLAISDIAIEGDFVPPPLACLSSEDQAFVQAFVASHGSIKKMEALFDISYPTVKNWLNRVAGRLDIPRVEVVIPERATERRGDILKQLDSGEISFDEAMEALK